MTDQEYMKLALTLASAAKGQTSPNPVVGAVVVKNGDVLGMGSHLKAGEGHAEVHALNMAGKKAEGATLYVTLEPCSHYGKTPPCADLVIERGIQRVVIAATDPNPEVAGAGIEKLKKAGINVITGILKEEAEWLNRYFFHFIKTGRPYVTLKAAASLDGKTATRNRDSKWITGKEAREDGHRLRHENDAILVGVGTVNTDDPALTVRLPNGGKNPIRIVLDSRLSINPNASMLQDNEAPVWIICTENAEIEKRNQLEEAGAFILSVQSDSLEINEILQLLGERNITSLYVEGGSSVHGSFLESKAFQEFVCYLAPKLIGGSTAPSIFGSGGIAAMSEALELEILSTEQIGEDIKITAHPRLKER